jgi:uncharacterized repeat protein (TIGR03803 family)
MRIVSIRTFAGGCVIFAGLFLAGSVHAQSYSVLYSFAGGSDGSGPIGTLIRDTQGNLYGVTITGGHHNCLSSNGCGTVFKVSESGTETVLYRFHNTPDPSGPTSLILDGAGNLYGTGSSGGAYRYGSIFKIGAGGQESVFYNFPSKADGEDPFSNLIRDQAGNFYGITLGGGDFTFCSLNGCGTVYKVDKYGKHTVLHAFPGPPDGYGPMGGLVMDAEGNLFGTTSGGGTGTCGGGGGCGVVFKIDPHGAETIIHNFAGGANDGEAPDASLIMDADGNFYGTTVLGGASNAGTVFKLDKTGAVTLLHAFTYGSDGATPISNLVRDAAGNLYGMTYDGGLSPCGYSGCGVVYKLDSSANFSVLYSFTGGADGGWPQNGGLIRDSAGNLYGVTTGGGNAGYGVVFKIAP